MIQMIIAMLAMVTTLPQAPPSEELVYQVAVVTSVESGATVPVSLTSIAE